MSKAIGQIWKPKCTWMILAGEAFPLSDNLRHPFCGYNLPIKKKVFNYHQHGVGRYVKFDVNILSKKWWIFHSSGFPYCVVDTSVIATDTLSKSCFPTSLSSSFAGCIFPLLSSNPLHNTLSYYTWNNFYVLAFTFWLNMKTILHKTFVTSVPNFCTTLTFTWRYNIPL
jgi:hypothetical protein